ncbi:DUF3307 domain-containing protein [Lutibacter sp. TH_r2]|uniref:DUF3307 domain-containing protein n=1 Tax=Lutibacter sp. TH_r2 TaxID=3082083 RepID=UPI0029544C1A|nr:DUF3307 domain-containing protein [Lutibacter sp. TH_r2]MDV7188236.1 DUF3307 domain-containing protein [Lutibacter sp. TH_r2]
MIALVLKLLIAHTIGDFVFQPRKWVKSKEKKKHKSPYLYWHILVHFIALLTVFQFKTDYWLGILVIIISHYIIDLVKLNLKKKLNSRWLFLWDQLAHIVVIAFVVNLYKPFVIDVNVLFSSKVLLFVLSILMVTVVSSISMKVIISKWEIKSNSTKKSLEDAGMYIGIIERLLTFVFIITNNWSAIGFLLAAKSIFRFGDLTNSDDRKLTEYILIGTLISFGLAIFTGLAYNYVLKIL